MILLAQTAALQASPRPPDLSPPRATATPAVPCPAYAVHDQGHNDSQFFTVDLTTHAVAPLGTLHVGYDIEGLDLHPQTNVLIWHVRRR